MVLVLDPRAIYFKGQHSRTYVGWVDSFPFTAMSPE
jgi:hypothetical protein